MKDTLISFDTAKLAKEKGFNIKCYWYCSYNRKVPTNPDSFYPEHGEYKDFNNISGETYEIFSLPTQSLLQKWLREKHNIIVQPTYTDHWTSGKVGCVLSIFKINNGSCEKQHTPYESGRASTHFTEYEEALEKGLQEALKLI